MQSVTDTPELGSLDMLSPSFNLHQRFPGDFHALQLEQADQCHGLDASIFSDPPNIGSNPDVLLDLLLLHRRLRNRTCFGPILLYSMEER